jgi:F-type H+-transporting ATPase subunit gamma
MANIKDLKKKIKSTKGTLKITTAMKLVSAAKLNKAQQAILNARPYAEELEDTIKSVSALVQNYSHQYLTENKDNKRALLLVISGGKGLCGSYNSQIIKTVRNWTGESDLDVKVSFIGKKAWEILRGEVNLGKYYTFEKNEATFQEIQEIVEECGELFSNGEIGRVFVAYNKFHSAISCEPIIKQALPFTLSEAEKEEMSEKFPFDYKYEPTPKEILDSLIPEVLMSTVWTCFLDAQAAEHGSRMSAMDSAAGNCKDAIKSLTIKMNKLRQAAVTTELIEVVSGAESLNG